MPYCITEAKRGHTYANVPIEKVLTKGRHKPNTSP